MAENDELNPTFKPLAGTQQYRLFSKIKKNPFFGSRNAIFIQGMPQSYMLLGLS